MGRGSPEQRSDKSVTYQRAVGEDKPRENKREPGFGAAVVQKGSQGKPF